MPCPPAWSLPPPCTPIEWYNTPPFEATMPCEHNPVTIFPNAFTYIAINGEQVMTLGAVSLVAHTSGVLPIDRGGTGGTTPEQARTNLGLGSAATSDASDFATAAQGALATTALQPGDDAAALGSGAGIPAGWGFLADGVGGADWGAIPAALPAATQAEMEAGTEPDLRAMSPLLVRQGEDARFAAPPILGSMTPNRVDATEVRLNKAGSTAIDFERLRLGWSADVAQLDVSAGGAGISRTLQVSVAGKSRFEVPPDSFFSWRAASAAMDGPTYGANLLTEGGWTVGSGWTESPAGTFTHTSGSGVAALSHSAAVAIDTFYLCSYTITGRTTGSVTISFGGRSLAGVTATGGFGPTATSTTGLVVTPTSDFNGTITLTLVSITAITTAFGSFVDSTGNNRLVFRIPSAFNSTFWGLNSGGRATAFSANNTGIGASALLIVTTGIQNSAVGTNALSGCTTGNGNVAVGFDAGRFRNAFSARLENPTDCTFIGARIRANQEDISNCIVIGAGVTSLGSNTTIIGSSSTTLTRLQGTVEASLDFESVTNGKGVLLRSPNGTRYRITVNDAGAVIATAAP